MKRLLSIALISMFLVSTPTHAALTKIVVKPMKLLISVSDSDGVAGFLVVGKSIVLYGTLGENSFARAIDINGQTLWNIALDPNSPSIATAGVVDGVGNIWIAGATSLTRPSPTPSTSPFLNPDNVIAIPEAIQSDLSALAVWKIPAGSSESILFTSQQRSPVLVTGVAADKNGISLVGITRTPKGSSGLVVPVSLEGDFGKPVSIGNSSTTLEAVVRNIDGSTTVTGSSAETIGGKKLAGIIDGVIIKLSKTNTILTVIRSSASKAKRNWNSATSTFLLGGEVVTGNKIESAVTKFSKDYVPVWTYRFLSTGPVFTQGSTYALFASSGVIPQLSKWAPKSPQPLLLKFDAKGAIIEASTAPADQREIIAFVNSKEFGVLCLMQNSQTISFYTVG
ncbi:MAG: hypothetical protein F2954_05020 [Actinobacteria bacterium]|uniref:Unannotated protein n=1 Tax=freshwater metagenome TaxID=449393 RepID=A0A6J7VXJ5_9ZZZZ|nr:hypothetical protein [Actinomycetota bacterium]